MKTIEFKNIAEKLAKNAHSNHWINLMLMRFRQQPIAKVNLKNGHIVMAYCQEELLALTASSIASIELTVSKSNVIPMMRASDLEELMAAQELKRLTQIMVMDGFLLTDPDTGASFSIS